MLVELDGATDGLSNFDPDYIAAHPQMLPVLLRLANISSKAEAKKKLGSVSDTSVSNVAAKRLAEVLNHREQGATSREQILQAIEPTLEGIVRDLVGRLLLETIVANALSAAGVPFRRESEYSHLRGVVYDFRADFVIPDETKPKCFIEVRKSSTRHASLYAKDKMFSAINWKGHNRDMLGILVAHGPWTNETLKVMARVFDYVVPLDAISDVAQTIQGYLGGDRSKLKWLIEFSIVDAASEA